MSPFGHRALVFPPMIMLCLGLRPAPFLRTRRPRPFEKNAFHLIPGLSPQGHPSLDGPPLEGRAPHARKDGIGLAGACPHLATGRSFSPDDYVVPRLASGPYLRTRRPRPSEKIIFRAISGLSPQGHPSLDGPPRGGAGSARPKGRNWPRRVMSPFGHRALVFPR
jgi:hypothetical protein